MLNKRETWIDLFKVLLIFLVVVGHSKPDPYTAKLIYGFHIPAFFIISGYLYRPSSWIKTTKSYFIPVTFLSLINLLFILYCCKDTWKLPDNFLRRIVEPFFYFKSMDGICLFMGFWFIVCLYLCRLSFGDIRKTNIIKTHYKLICTICVIIMTLHDYLPEIILNNKLHNLYFIRTIPCFPFFCFGYWYKNNKDKISLRYYWMILLLIIYFISCIWNKTFDIYGDKYGENYLFSAIVAIIGFICMKNLIQKIKLNNTLATIIEVLSKGTLFILGIHILIRNILWNKNIINSENLSSAFLIGIIVLILCYYPIKILIKRYPILIGRK